MTHVLWSIEPVAGFRIVSPCTSSACTGGTAPVPARPQLMVAGGRVLSEDGRGRTVTGPGQASFP